MAGAFIGIGALYLYLCPVEIGVIFLPAAFPMGFTAAGVWAMVAARWIDRHQAWDRVTTKQDRDAFEVSRTLMVRSLPLGLLLLATGGAAGALVGWLWETEVGMPVGIAFGAVVGFVLGTLLAGIREGVRSKSARSVDVKLEDAE